MYNNERQKSSGISIKFRNFSAGFFDCTYLDNSKRKLLSAYWHEGKCYEFNFSKFWTFTRTKFDCKETDTQIIWHVEQKTWRNRMVTDITCEKKDMFLVNYEAPNGKKLHNRLWNGGNGKGTAKLYRDNKLIDEVICENAGCEYGEYDHK